MFESKAEISSSQNIGFLLAHWYFGVTVRSAISPYDLFSSSILRDLVS